MDGDQGEHNRTLSPLPSAQTARISAGDTFFPLLTCIYKLSQMARSQESHCVIMYIVQCDNALFLHVSYFPNSQSSCLDKGLDSS